MKPQRLPFIALSLMAGLVVGAEARADASRERVLQRGIDPVTGAEITVSRADSGLVTIDVRTSDVRVRKQIAAARSTTTVATASDELVIDFDRTRLSVSRGGTRIDVTPEHQERMAAARSLITQSTAAGRAARLLGQIGLRADAPTRVMLLSTRVLLQAGNPDPSTRADAAHLIESARTRTGRVTRVALEEDGPTDCWNKYAAEAIAAYMEYEDCMKQVKWYDLFGPAACALVYDMRALGAFSWWLGCVSFRA
jgi:hypothetical protein